MGRKRVALIAIAACGAMAALGTGTAWAAGETVVTYAGSPGSGSKLAVSAAPGQKNDLVVANDDEYVGTLNSRILIRDAIGVTEDSPYCNQPSPTEVRCQAHGLERLIVHAGDRGDQLGIVTNVPDVTVIPNVIVRAGSGDDLGRAVATVDTAEDFVLGFPYVFSGGPGNDRGTVATRISSSSTSLASRASAFAAAATRPLLSGGAGRDRLRIKAGRGTIRGGANADTLRGGLGPQRLFGNAGSDWFSCGKGKDLANGGPGKDRAGASCETGPDLEIYLPDF